MTGRVLISGDAIPMSDFWPENIILKINKYKKEEKPLHSRITISHHVVIIKLIAGKGQNQAIETAQNIREATKMKWQKKEKTSTQK
jgi:hypothetical protein